MRPTLVRTFFGGGLILLGALMLLEKIGLLRGASTLFWGVLMLLGAAFFLYEFLQSPRSRWWAIIPGMALLGMAGSTVLPLVFSGLGGGIFLGALGLAFIIIYLSDHSRWWGLIPGGTLLTLAVISVFENTGWANNGSLFFVGLGLTFLLVGILPNPLGNTQWAYIPATVLVLMGALLGTQSTAGLVDYIWPSALIIVGLVVIGRFLFNKQE